MRRIREGQGGRAGAWHGFVAEQVHAIRAQLCRAGERGRATWVRPALARAHRAPRGLSWCLGACLCVLWSVADVRAEPPPLDLNRAEVPELCELPGIGVKRAEAIVARRKRKPFSRISQLLEIRGIGGKTLARLKPRLFVGREGQHQVPSLHPLALPQAAPGGPAREGG